MNAERCWVNARRSPREHLAADVPDQARCTGPGLPWA